MPDRVQFTFTSFRQSWTENYIYLATGMTQGFLQPIIDLANRRAALLGQGASLTRIRYGSIPANRSVLDVDFNTFKHVGDWPAGGSSQTYNTNIANVSVILKVFPVLAAVAQPTKLLYLAGCPEGVVQADATPPISVEPANATGFTDALNAFITSLTNGQWACRSQKATTLVQALGPPQLGTQTPPLIGIPLNAVQPWQVGQKVLLSGWRRFNPRSPGLSGVFTLAGVPAATQVNPPFLYYLFGTQAVNPGNFKTTGSIGLIAYQFPVFSAAVIDRATSRKRGGRIGLPLGKFSRVH